MSIWHPIAAAQDVPPGHIYQTMLHGRGLALWRSTDGAVHVWEDRCPHRGVRLSLGEIAGDDLVCQYHAWRFAGATGRCVFIPAQPGLAPPSAIRATSFPVAEAHGLIWTGAGDLPLLPPGEVLRAIPVNRDAAEVEAALAPFSGMTLMVQPVAPGRCVIRGLAHGVALIEADDALEALRRRLEAVPA